MEYYLLNFNNTCQIVDAGQKRPTPALFFYSFGRPLISGVVVFLSGMVEGKRHDKTLAQDLNLKIQQNITLGLDSAFRKLDFHKNVKIEIPHRKPRKKELCDEKKDQNRQMSSKRVIVENALAGCKRMRIAKDVIRPHGDYVKELTFSTAVRLHNFRTFSRNHLCS